MAEGGATADGPPDAGQSDAPGSNADPNAAFECNICLDVAKDAVVSLCGHLFCWPCLHQWLSTRPDRQICPVCKAGISKDKVIPLYGRGNSDSKDPREKLPPRPAAQRPEPENTGRFGNFNVGGFQMSFGIGAFPLSFFASNMNMFEEYRPSNPEAGTQQHREEQVLSQIFLFVAIFFAVWLILA